MDVLSYRRAVKHIICLINVYLYAFDYCAIQIHSIFVFARKTNASTVATNDGGDGFAVYMHFSYNFSESDRLHAASFG